MKSKFPFTEASLDVTTEVHVMSVMWRCCVASRRHDVIAVRCHGITRVICDRLIVVEKIVDKMSFLPSNILKDIEEPKTKFSLSHPNPSVFVRPVVGITAYTVTVF